MTDGTLQERLDAARRQIDELIRRGRYVRDAPAVDAVRAWQTDCAAVVNQLSGGSKAHWLARAYSGAFLMRSADGGVIVAAEASEIVDRILDVLRQADRSLCQVDPAEDTWLTSDAARPVARRFDAVRNAGLRAVLERTLIDSKRVFDAGDFKSALITACSILEAIITDALESNASSTSNASNASDASSASSALSGAISAWSFEARIAAAEKAGLIGYGCARLPPVARRYRDLLDLNGELRPDVTVSARDARVVRQVLLVIMRDLDPSR